MNMETASFVLLGIASFCIFLIIGVDLYLRIRPRFKISVNCWFCNLNVRVPYKDRNSWNCTGCSQYNGFLPDGGYNKDIPAQRDPCHNNPVISKKNVTPSSNGLCEKCNANQELKIRQLALFTPSDESRFDQEISQLKQHLEEVFELCSLCKCSLSNTLIRQKAWLLGLNMTRLRDGTLFLKVSKVALFSKLSTHLVCIVLASWLLLPKICLLYKTMEKSLPWILSSNLLTLPEGVTISPYLSEIMTISSTMSAYLTALGLILQLFIIQKSRRRIDVICTSLWVILHGQCWLNTWSVCYATEENILLIHSFILLSTLVTCVGATVKAREPQRQNVLNKMKMQKPKNNVPFSEPKLSSHSFKQPLKMDNSLNSSFQSFRSTQNTLDQEVNTIHQNQTLLHPIKFPLVYKGGEINSVKPRCGINNSQSNLTSVTDGWQPNNQNKRSAFTPIKPPNDISDMLNETMCNFALPVTASTPDTSDELLSCSEKQPEELFQNLNIGPSDKGKSFSMDDGYSDLFNQKNHTLRNRRHRPILSPSRMDVRWSPIGYNNHSTNLLNEINMFAPLSRSSSQSSGFASQSSHTILDTTNSRGSSVCDDDTISSRNPFYSVSKPQSPVISTHRGPQTCCNYQVYSKPDSSYSPDRNSTICYQDRSFVTCNTSFDRKTSPCSFEDNNSSVYSQGFAYKPSPSPIYSPQPLYIQPSFSPGYVSPYGMQYCFPQHLPLPQPSKMDNTSWLNHQESSIPSRPTHHYIFSFLLLFGIIINLVIFVRNSYWGIEITTSVN